MKYSSLLATFLLLNLTTIYAMAEMNPVPIAEHENVIDNYFGQQIPDPFRWMEKGPQDPKFMKFLQEQDRYTKTTLERIAPARNKLLARIVELDNAVSAVRSWQRTKDNIFFLQLLPGENTASLMVRDNNGASRKLIDPTKFDDNGKHASIDYYRASPDSKYVIVGISIGGSENSTIRIVETANGKILPDTISRTQYSGPSWTADSKTFAYARLQALEANSSPSEIYENQRVYLHVLGEDPDKDKVLFGPGVSKSGPQVPKAGFNSVEFCTGSNYAIATHSAGTTDSSALYITKTTDLLAGKSDWNQIASSTNRIANCESSIQVHGQTMYVMLDKDCPNRKLVSINLAEPDLNKPQAVVPESKYVLLGIFTAADGLYLQYKEGIEFYIQKFSYDEIPAIPDKTKAIKMPYEAAISGIDSCIDLNGLSFRLESWTKSGQAFEYNPKTATVSNLNLIPKHPAESAGIEAREVHVSSTDKAEIPISIVSSKNTKLDSSHPTILVGYGAYGVSIDPGFDPSAIAWLERGGIIAFAHIRGGGEFGEWWHGNARRHSKQHSIDDMIAAAHFLIDEKYTSPSNLAIKGTSAGGIAACGAAVRNPELFAVCIDNVGMTDMLRFQTTQGGAANIPEFGDVNKEEDFKHLLEVSAYHNVVNGKNYPAFMGITGANDPRVPSWIIAKMVARLQEATPRTKPVLLRVDFDAGHGMGSNRTQREQQMADERSFILWQTKHPDFRAQSPD